MYGQVLEIKKKDINLISAYATIFKIGASPAEATQELDSSCKTIKDFDLSLNEARKGWKNVQYEHQDMHLENLESSEE